MQFSPLRTGDVEQMVFDIDRVEMTRRTRFFEFWTDERLTEWLADRLMYLEQEDVVVHIGFDLGFEN